MLEETTEGEASSLPQERNRPPPPRHEGNGQHAAEAGGGAGAGGDGRGVGQAGSAPRGWGVSFPLSLALPSFPFSSSSSSSPPPSSSSSSSSSASVSAAEVTRHGDEAEKEKEKASEACPSARDTPIAEETTRATIDGTPAVGAPPAAALAATDGGPGMPRRLGEWLWGMRGYVGGYGYQPIVGGVGLVVGLPLHLAGRLNPFSFGGARSGQYDQGDDGPEAAIISTYAQDFNARIVRPEAQPLLDQINQYVADHDAGASLEEQGASLHAFVDSMEAQMVVHPLWSHLPADSGRALLVECLERYLTHALHSKIFLSGPAAARQDEALFNRILSLQFIGPRHLGLPAELADVSLESAQEDLFTINSKRSPYEKTCCLLRCARNILRKLAEATRRGTDEIGADDFLPGLIYLLLKANPPLLHSNLRYISCFRHPARAVGEGAYYYIHFLSAISFIENVNAALLNMDPEDFELGLRDPDAFAAKEAIRLKEEEEAKSRERERRSSEGDEGDSGWIYVNKTNQAGTVSPGRMAQVLCHEVGTQTDLSAFAPHSLEPDPSLDRYLHANAADLSPSDVDELLRQYRTLLMATRHAPPLPDDQETEVSSP